jgi:hypothetical protein
VDLLLAKLDWRLEGPVDGGGSARGGGGGGTHTQCHWLLPTGRKAIQEGNSDRMAEGLRMANWVGKAGGSIRLY